MKYCTDEEYNYYYQLLYNDKTDEAIKYIRKLHSKYPYDNIVTVELGSILLRQKKNISEAKYFLKLGQNSHNINRIYNELGIYYLSIGDFIKAKEFFYKIDEKDILSRAYKLNGLLKVYIHTGEYDKARRCCYGLKVCKSTGIFNIDHLYNIQAFVFHKLGILNNPDHNNYYIRQLLSYSREAAIEHIENHKIRITEENKAELPKSLAEKTVHSVFADNVNVTELYNLSEEYIKDKKPDGYSYVDYYSLKLDNTVGETIIGNCTEHIEIVTFPNTKNILTIYPKSSEHLNKATKFREKEEKPKKNNKKYIKKLKKKPKK